jgi:phospholipid transport system substrate-binding protein
MSLWRGIRGVVMAASLVWVLACGTAWAGPPTDLVREKQTALFALLEKEPTDQAKVDAIFDEMLDYRGLAEASLGAEWGRITEAQQAEFTSLLEQLVTRAYEKHLKKIIAYRVDYLDETSEGEGVFLVRTRATHKTDKRAEQVTVSFKLASREKGRFKVIDLVIEEVSLVESYRSQFTKVLKKEGWDGLIKKMKEKIAAGE